MDAAVKKMEAQLQLWGLQIDHLAAKTERAGVQPRFDILMHIDELKALHAIAQARLGEFKAKGDGERRRLEAEIRSAWNDLEAAFERPMP